MMPYYFPYVPSYYYAEIPQYSQEYVNIPQFYTLAQELCQEQYTLKNQEINTNYSISGAPSQEKQNQAQQCQPLIQTNFQSPKDCNLKIAKFAQGQKNKIEDSQECQSKKKCHQRLRYINKNYESNIINKIFSFLWSEQKSKAFVSRILKDRTKTVLYFDYMKIIRKYCKRYINKEYLMNLCDYQPQHIAYRIVARHVDKLRYFSMQELSKTIRRLIYIYLKDVCTISILTSKKMRSNIWSDHFEKSRNITQFLFGGLSAEQYDRRMSMSYEKIYGQPEVLQETVSKLN